MSQQGATISPEAEAILYFVGLVLIYLAAWSRPIGAPDVVRTAFALVGMAAIVVKYELSNFPKPQITTHQVIYSTVALILSLAGWFLSALYGGFWWAGLAVAVIGALLAAYQDLGGQVPPATTSPTTTTAPAAVQTTGG